MKKTWEYFKGVRKFFIFFCIFLAVQLLLTLYFPELLRNITKMVTEKEQIGDSNVWDIVISGVLAFGVAILTFLFAAFAEYFSSVATDHFGKNVRAHLFEKMQNVPTESINQIGSATLLPVVMNDVNWMKNWQKRLAITTLYVIINFFGGFLMLYLIRPEYALIALCSLPFVFLFFILSARSLDETINQSIAMFDALYHNTKEGIIGAKEIRIFNKSEERAVEFDKYVKIHRKQDLQTTTLFNLSSSFHTVLFTIITACIILYGALTRNDVGLLSDLNAAIMYINMIWAGSHYVYQNIVDYIPRIKYTKRRIDKVLNLSEDIDQSGVKAEPSPRDRYLEFENVSYKFPNNARGLENINIVIERNTRVAIVGGIGSGKNLVPQMILQTLQPDSGRVMLSGMEIQAINKTFFRRNILSLCEPDPEFMPGTIRDNLKILNPEATDEQIIAVFHELGLNQMIDKFGGNDEFLNYVMSERTTFNDATKNLLNIVRSLLKPASLYIFNQCFDHIKQEYIVKLLAKLRREKRTCLFVTHGLWICKHVNNVYIMSNGKVSGSGTHEKLAKSNKDYKEIFAIGGGEEFTIQGEGTAEALGTVVEKPEEKIIAANFAHPADEV